MPEDVSFGPDAIEWVASILVGPHECSDRCICQEVRQVPAIAEAMKRIGKPHYQGTN